MVGDLHVEAARAARDDLADAAQAQDAELLARYPRGQRKAALRPALRAHEAVTMGNAARRIDQQAESQVGHAVVEYVRRVADLDATGARGVQRDGVIANAEADNGLKAGQRGDQRGSATVPG